MTRAKRRRSLRHSAALAALALAALTSRPAHAISLDDRGEMRFGLRAYNAVRIGTEHIGGEDDPLNFPRSGAGHVRQHRYFLELKLDHDLTRLSKEGLGFARLFGWLNLRELAYSLQYRGEGEGIYDYGPDEYSHQARTLEALRLDAPTIQLSPKAPILSSPKIPPEFIRRRVSFLRRIARQRHRFFLGYVDVEKGPLFVRIGRQILAWGETDVFRLLDNINPLDDSFGGFFIALDERRLPLDMLRASYQIGSVGPISDAFLEGFGALGNRVATFPGIPPGSPWMPGGLGFPLPQLVRPVDLPAKDDFRGGGRFVFNYLDTTFTLAHYYTYLDIPGVRFELPGAVPIPGTKLQTATPNFGNPIVATQHYPLVPITGASATFPIPAYYSVVRSEAAFFNGEPMNRQGRGSSADSTAPPPSPGHPSPGYERLKRENNTEGGLDPFVWPGFLNLTRTGPIQGTVLRRDTFNLALGLDVNRYVRWLNPTQTLFVTTQFFWKHVFDSPGDLVLPVPYRNLPVAKNIPFAGAGCGGAAHRPCRLEPRLFHLDDDRFLHTLQISTAYSGGRVLPSFGMFYDWQGVYVLQPGLTLVRDPFRFITDYTCVQGAPSGQFGTVRDRDNVRFQIEYVF